MSLSSVRRAAVVAATSTLATAAALLVAVVPAHAELGSVGPVDPTLHFPAAYTDTNGVALELCLDGPPRCLAAFDDLVPAHEDGLDAEAFYFNADADVGGIVVSNALEAAYADDGPDQELVFVRNQIAHRDGALVPGAEYVVTDPYGTLTACEADANGNIRNNACRTELVSPPLDFTGALAGRIGPFLTWDTYGAAVGAPPSGYIGDGETPHRVTGSPTGFNKVRITGPGINASGDQPCAADWTGPAEDCGETDLFIVQGKVQPSQSARLTPAGLTDFGNTADPVARTFTYTSTGADPVAVTDVALTGDATFTSTDTCLAAGDLAAGDTCTVELTYTPPETPGTSAATLTLTDSAGLVRSVDLAAATVGVPTRDRASIAFGSQKVGTASATEIVTVGNDGAAPLSVDLPAFTGFGGSHFAVDDNACTTPVAPGGGCEITVSFRPTSAGAKSAQLSIPTDGGTLSVAVSGTGTTPVVSLSPTSLDFIATDVGGTSAPRTVTVTNSGTAGLTVEDVVIGGTDAAQFALATGGTCVSGLTVAPTGTCTLRAVSSPTAAGPAVATLSLIADGTSFDVALAGEGVATTPGAPTIGTVTGGNARATVRWTLGSDGGSALTGHEIQVLRNGSVVRTVTGLGAGATSATIAGLTNGTAYAFRVRGLNAVGAGALSATSAVVRPATVPGAPRIRTASSGVAGGPITATATWLPPTSTGGAAISGYVVRALRLSTTGRVLATRVSGVLPAGARSLRMALPVRGTYRFTVQARNAAGSGAQSVRSNAVSAR